MLDFFSIKNPNVASVMHFFLSNVDFESIYCRDSGGLNDCFELKTTYT